MIQVENSKMGDIIITSKEPASGFRDGVTREARHSVRIPNNIADGFSAFLRALYLKGELLPEQRYPSFGDVTVRTTIEPELLLSEGRDKVYISPTHLLSCLAQVEAAREEWLTPQRAMQESYLNEHLAEVE